MFEWRVSHWPATGRPARSPSASQSATSPAPTVDTRDSSRAAWHGKSATARPLCSPGWDFSCTTDCRQTTYGGCDCPGPAGRVAFCKHVGGLGRCMRCTPNPNATSHDAPRCPRRGPALLRPLLWPIFSRDESRPTGTRTEPKGRLRPVGPARERRTCATTRSCRWISRNSSPMPNCRHCRRVDGESHKRHE